jgi:hypothetical protein
MLKVTLPMLAKALEQFAEQPAASTVYARRHFRAYLDY